MHISITRVVAAARQAGADVWVHERDAGALAGMRQAKPERARLE